MVALINTELSSDWTNFNYLIQLETDVEVWHSPYIWDKTKSGGENYQEVCDNGICVDSWSIEEDLDLVPDSTAGITPNTRSDSAPTIDDTIPF
jgi:hypothetical protein